jgi:hypothetical protein
MELAYFTFIEIHSLEDTLYLRTVFEAGYKAGAQNQIKDSHCESL